MEHEPFSDYWWQIRFVPGKLKHLLNKEGLTISAELQQNILDCYSRFVAAHASDAPLSQIAQSTLTKFAQDAGIPLPSAALPLALLNRFIEEETRTRTLRRCFTESQLIECLTFQGTYPLNHCFFLNGSLYVIDSSFQLSVRRIENNQLFSECQAFLTSRGANYDSLDELVEKIRRERWPDWEHLLQALGCPRHSQ